MSLSVYIDGKFALDVATNTGWNTFVVWADQVARRGGALRQLVEQGVTEEVSLLASELKSAPEAGDPDIDSVKESLLNAAKQGGRVLIVSDGLGDV